MNKQVRDWQFDTQLCSKVKEIGHTDVSADIVTDIAIYWLQQYAAAEAREKKLQEENKQLNVILKSIENENERMLNGEGMEAYEEALASLYSKEEESKKYTFKATLHIYNGIRTTVNGEQLTISSQSAEQAEKELRESIESKYRHLSHLLLSSLQLELVEEE